VRNRVFHYPDYRQYVIFTTDTLDHMYPYAQRWPWSKEAGGEIYSPAPFEPGLIVSSAIGPTPHDIRKRHLFKPDIDALTLHRNWRYEQGQHVVGLWHTHPEEKPSPSIQDQKTTLEYLSAFQGGRDRYLLVILGDKGVPLNMSVWVAEDGDSKKWFRLIEEK